MSMLSCLERSNLKKDVSPEVLNWRYQGASTHKDPYRVAWIENDSGNPRNLSKARRWIITMLVGVQVLAVTFASSASSGALRKVERHFDVSTVVATLGTSVFVCKHAAESTAFMEKMKENAIESTGDAKTSSEKNSDIEAAK